MSSKVLLVFGHGRQEGLGHALREVAEAELEAVGARVFCHDLLSDGFDPRLRLEPEERYAGPCSADRDPLVHRYQQEVRVADAFLFLHPVWWFAPPAILKGWIDRVLVHDVAIRQQETGPPLPILQGTRGLVVQTFNSSAKIDQQLFSDFSQKFWKKVVFPSIGMEYAGRVAIYDAESITPSRLAQHQDALRQAIRSVVAALALMLTITLGACSPNVETRHPEAGRKHGASSPDLEQASPDFPELRPASEVEPPGPSSLANADPAQRRQRLRDSIRAKLGSEYDTPLPEVSEKEREKGEAIWRGLCVGCHGEDGRGRRSLSQMLPVPPGDLTDPEVDSFFSARGKLAIVTDGSPGTPMIGWKDVLEKESDRIAVLAYLQTLVTQSRDSQSVNPKTQDS